MLSMFWSFIRSCIVILTHLVRWFQFARSTKWPWLTWPFQNFETKRQSISYLSCLNGSTISVRDGHCYIGSPNDRGMDIRFASFPMLNVTINFKGNVGNGSVGQVIIAVDRESKITCCDNHVMVLDNDIICKGACINLLHVTHHIMEWHYDVKVKGVGDIVNTWIRFGFCVNFSIEHFWCLDWCNHFLSPAKDGHWNEKKKQNLLPPHEKI